MEGIITIRLLRRDLPPSGLTDLGFDANWLLKDLPKLPYTDKDGNQSHAPCRRQVPNHRVRNIASVVSPFQLPPYPNYACRVHRRTGRGRYSGAPTSG